MHTLCIAFCIVPFFVKVKGRLVLGALRGLFEGAYYNTQMGEVCAVYSRVQSILGRGLIEEIPYIITYSYFQLTKLV